MEQRIASFTATSLGPGWLQHLPRDFWFTFGLRNELRQSSFVGFVSRPVLPSTHCCPLSASCLHLCYQRSCKTKNPTTKTLLGGSVGARRRKIPRTWLQNPVCKKGKTPQRARKGKSKPQQNNNRNHNQASSTQRPSTLQKDKIFFFFFVPINNLP